jgi:hypothetical protein
MRPISGKLELGCGNGYYLSSQNCAKNATHTEVLNNWFRLLFLSINLKDMRTRNSCKFVHEKFARYLQECHGLLFERSLQLAALLIRPSAQ